MALSLEETPDSRQWTANPPGLTVRMRAAGEVDEFTVANAVYWGTPQNYFHQLGKLWRQNITLDPAGHALYYVTVPYTPRKRETGKFTFSFDTTGGQIHVTHAKEHIADYGLPGDPDGNDINPYKGLIGVDQDQNVAGTDMVVPALKLTYAFIHPEGVVNEAMARNLGGATGRTNSALWRGFAPGELLYLGSTGSDGTEAEAELAYQFVASQNGTRNIGEFLSIALKGHEYAWVSYKRGVANNKPVIQPQRLFVERLYDPINFEDTFGWS